METRNKRLRTFDFKSEKKELIKFLQNSKLNSNGSSLESPFFQIDGKEKYNIKEMENKFNNNYVIFMNKNNFPIKLKILYLLIGNVNTEINYKGFIFNKLEEIIDNFDNFKSFFDIGMIYHGMGHVVKLSIVKESKNKKSKEINDKFFLRLEGGAEYFSRLYNQNFFQNLSRKELLNYKEKITFRNFSEIFDLINYESFNEKIENFEFMKNNIIKI